MKKITQQSYFKRLIILNILIISIISNNYGQAYYYNFDTLNTGTLAINGSGWTSSSYSNPSWRCGTLTQSINTGPITDHTTETSTGKFIYLETSSPASLGDIAYATSPNINFGSATSVILKFWYYMYGISTGSLSVEQKINGSWQQVGSVLSGQQQNTQNSAWHQAYIILNPNASAIRFKGETGNDITGDIAIDDVLIYSPATNDIGISHILSPTYGDTTNPSIPITVNVWNWGINPQHSIEVSYSIDNGITFVTEVISDTIQPSDSLVYTFTNLADISNPGLYRIKVSTNNIGDLYNHNDSLSRNIGIGPLNGNFTIGQNSTNDFNSFKESIHTLNSLGIDGPVTFMVDTGVYRENLLLENINGASITNRISYIGNGDSTIILSNEWSTSHSTPIINFDSAKFFIFDNLTLQDTIQSIIAFHFMNESDSNIIRNCTTDLKYGGSYDIVSSDNPAEIYQEGNAANGTLIENNNFTGNNGIKLVGRNENDLCSGNKILNNKVTKINLWYQDAPKINNNKCNNINSSYGKNALSIKNNTVYDVSTNYSTGITIYYHNSILPYQDTAIVYNNAVYANYNSLRIKNSNNIKLINNTFASGSHIYSTTGSIDTCTGLILYNNIFINDNNRHALYCRMQATNLNNDYNNLYTGGNYLFHISGNVGNSINDWKTATIGGLHAQSIDPLFISNDTLTPTSLTLDNKGIYRSETAYDINGNPRDPNSPDIGAYEFGHVLVNLGNDTTICSESNLTLDAGNYLGATYIWKKGNLVVGNTRLLSIDSAGTYTVLLNMGSIISTDTITVSVFPNTIPSITGLHNTYCKSDSSITLSGFPSGGTFTGAGTNNNIFDPSIAGSGIHEIFYTVTDVSGCILNTSDTTMVFPNPIVNLGNDTVLKWTTASILLDAGNPNGNWLWSNNINSQFQTFDSTNLVNGQINTIYVIVTENSCVSTDTILIELINDVAITTESDNFRYQIFPNPANEYINISTENYYGNMHIEIINLEGKVITSKSYNISNSFNKKLDVNNLLPGTYMIKLYMKETILTKKIIIQ